MRCANLSGEDQRKNVLEMFGDEHLIKRLHFLGYSKRAKTFTLPKNIITDFSLARVLCNLHCMMNQSRNPLFTLHASAVRYSSTVTGADQPCLGKFLKRLYALHH